MKSTDLKNMLEEAAKVVKGARDESKELKQLANKEGSVASKSPEVASEVLEKTSCEGFGKGTA